MKSIRSWKLLMNLGLLAAAFGVFAGQAKAQSVYTGKFTLPFEARWGSEVLKPGDYSISLGDSTLAPGLLVLTGEGKKSFIMASATDFDREYSRNSKLILVDKGAGFAVQTLVAGEAGITASYAVPKVKIVKTAQTQESKRMVSVMIANN